MNTTNTTQDTIWTLEECHEVGIFNQSYMITTPDDRWPNDPEERRIVCRFPTGLGRFGPHYENARLISTAPQLLSALEVINHLTQYGDAFIGDIQKICQTAIRKATGK